MGDAGNGVGIMMSATVIVIVEDGRWCGEWKMKERKEEKEEIKKKKKENKKIKIKIKMKEDKGDVWQWWDL